MNHRVTESLDIEMRALEREQAGAVHQFRLEHLAIRLESGPVAVQETICGFTADRLAMVLDGGDTLVVRLLSRCRTTIAALCSIRWDRSTRLAHRRAGIDRRPGSAEGMASGGPFLPASH